jgi:Zn-finger nucleic acid-binding protein
MKCSLCMADLEPIDIGQNAELMADRCKSCGGMWLNKGAVSRLDESVWVNRQEHVKLPRHGGTHGIVMCPKCATSLEPLCLTDVAKLVVDCCPKCEGLWLDIGEISVLADAIKTKRPDLLKGSKSAPKTERVAGSEPRTNLGELIGKLSDLL